MPTDHPGDRVETRAQRDLSCPCIGVRGRGPAGIRAFLGRLRRCRGSVSQFRQRATVPQLRRGQDIGGYVERYHPRRSAEPLRDEGPDPAWLFVPLIEHSQARGEPASCARPGRMVPAVFLLCWARRPTSRSGEVIFHPSIVTSQAPSGARVFQIASATRHTPSGSLRQISRKSPWSEMGPGAPAGRSVIE